MAELSSAATPILVLTFLLIVITFYISPFNNHKTNTNFLTSSSSSNVTPLLATSTSTSPENHHTHIRKNITSLETIEEGLARAREAIRKASKTKIYTSDRVEDFIPTGPAYRNPYAFHQSHIEMVKRFKIWSYREGEPPLVHAGPFYNLYSTEGHFIDEMDRVNNPYAAQSPGEAHAFFLPFSIANAVGYLYRPLISYDRTPIHHVVNDYVRLISERHIYWNRSNGGDHFMAACHDWGPDASGGDPKLYKNFIRVLCNANTSEGFKPRRDVSIPGIMIGGQNLNLPQNRTASASRSILGFFAGGKHGYIRTLLIDYWKDKDNEVQVHEYLPKGQNYTELLNDSKYCFCPSGYEVGSPRLTETIRAACVPVIISDHYALPFSDVLDWNQFSVNIPVDNIPDIKKILQAIPHEKYLELQKGVIKVQQHFTLNRPPQSFDLIHMILHSVWLRRLNLRLSSLPQL